MRSLLFTVTAAVALLCVSQSTANAQFGVQFNSYRPYSSVRLNYSPGFQQYNGYGYGSRGYGYGYGSRGYGNSGYRSSYRGWNGSSAYRGSSHRGYSHGSSAYRGGHR